MGGGLHSTLWNDSSVGVGVPAGEGSTSPFSAGLPRSPEGRSPAPSEPDASVPRLIWANHSRLITRAGLVTAVALAVLGWSLWPSGTQWVIVSNPAPSSQLTALSCAKPDACLATDGDQLLMLTDRGRTWAPAGNTIDASDQILGAACGARRCLVASEDGAVLLSFDGGADFTFASGGFSSPEGFAQAGFPMVHAGDQAGYISAGAVSCDPSGSTCLVMRGVTNVAESGGPGDGTFVLTRRTCGRNCRGLQEGSIQFFPNAEGVPLTPDCVTSTVCWAIGQSGSHAVWRTTDAGSTWVGLSQPNAGVRGGLLTLDSISCVTTAACAVGDDSGDVYFTDDAGRTWSDTTIEQWQGIVEPCNGSATYCADDQLESNPVSSLFCWTKTHCLAASEGAPDTSWQDGSSQPSNPNGAIAVTTDAGATWSSESIPNGVSVSAVSCITGGECWAVGESTAPVSNPRGIILRLDSP